MKAKAGERCKLVDLRSGNVTRGVIESVGAGGKRAAIFQADDLERFFVPLDENLGSSFLKPESA